MVVEPADTLHGQLQRGRGVAARQAVQARGAGELVYDCITRDPRWDHQVEPRSLYYGRLIVDLELPTGPIAAHLFDPADHEDADEWRTSLAIETLADLVRLTRRQAAGPLREYVLDGWNWDEALDALLALDDPSLVEGLDEIALERCSDDELLWLLEPGTKVSGAWAERHRRFASAVQARNALLTRRAPRPGQLHEQSDDELIDLARVDDRLARAALIELGRRRNPVVLDLAEELLPRYVHGRAAGVSRAIRDLGPLAVARARTWVEERRLYADVGFDVLASYGTVDDAPALQAEFAAALRREDWGLAVELVFGLGRLRIRDALPLLRDSWEVTPYALVRRQILAALARIGTPEAEPYAFEALWDCSEETRRKAAQIVPLDDTSRSRLRRLSRDDAEDAEVRRAAQERFQTATA